MAMRRARGRKAGDAGRRPVIEIRIDELVVDGRRDLDPDRLAQAIRAEIADRVRSGLEYRAPHVRRVDSLDGGAIDRRTPDLATAAGRQLGRLIDEVAKGGSQP